jgi:hypothetical protein
MQSHSLSVRFPLSTSIARIPSTFYNKGMTTVLAITFQYSAWQGDEPFHIHAELLAHPRPQRVEEFLRHREFPQNGDMP